MRRGRILGALLVLWCITAGGGAAGAARPAGMIVYDASPFSFAPGGQNGFEQDAQRRGRKSPYYAWFQRDGSGKPVHYFDWTNLENLDYGGGAFDCLLKRSHYLPMAA
jgi:hypothetical protein